MAMMRGHLKLRKRKPVCHASEMCRGEERRGDGLPVECH